MTNETDVVLILGSGPNAVKTQDMPRPALGQVVAINNAWRVLKDWDYCIHPEDFPAERHPPTEHGAGKMVTYESYVPIQNTYGGFVYAGGTMAFTAAYWALGALRPKVMAFLGCDMVYAASGNTHFYGTGEADPLRADVTLQSLEGKSARLGVMAARQGCHCVNLSQDESRLVFPRHAPDALAALMSKNAPATTQADVREADLGYMVTSGRYWNIQDRFDAAALREIDALWLEAYHGLMA